MTAAVVTVAIIFGGTLGGMAAVPLLHQFGRPALFVVGALLSLALAPALGTWLPDRPRPPVPSGSTGGSVAALFQAGLALPTALLWAMAFLTFMPSYTFTYWLPPLLTSFGFGRPTAALGNTYIGSGAIAGVVLMVLLVRFVGSARYLAIAFAVGTCFVLLLALGGLPADWIPALLFLIGAGLGIGGVGQAAIGCHALSDVVADHRHRPVLRGGAAGLDPGSGDRRHLPRLALAGAQRHRGGFRAGAAVRRSRGRHFCRLAAPTGSEHPAWLSPRPASA
jgi:hypothetical protein